MSTSTAIAASPTLLTEYDAVTKTMGYYVESVKKGQSAIMKPAFHPGATFYGYFKGQLLAGSAQILFDWVDGNGPVSELQTRITRVEIHETIAQVTLEMDQLTGKISTPEGGRLSDQFQLIKVDGEWKICQKSFHWY